MPRKPRESSGTGIQSSGVYRRHRKGVRRTLLQDYAQDVGAVRQDRQPVAQCGTFSRRQGKGMAPLRPGQQAGDGTRRVRYPPGKGVRGKDRGLGEDLFPHQVLYALTGSSYLSPTAFLRRQWGYVLFI